MTFPEVDSEFVAGSRSTGADVFWNVWPVKFVTVTPVRDKEGSFLYCSMGFLI